VGQPQDETARGARRRRTGDSRAIEQLDRGGEVSGLGVLRCGDEKAVRPVGSSIKRALDALS
jgi:hypothetical protein